ncbi:MAG TPA: alpha/beta fold hydrolase [Bacteroidales bacterium]|nr:alpha/beta fold hydrolase [Bacteroidales bacterium]HPT09000.1 alpha/beta fold hydrolase [Bacteroidales bacterium]
MDLFCRQMGSGDPVIILHGLFGLSDNWVTFGRRLATHYQVLIPDLRNHGQSPHSDRFDFQLLANDLSELIESHGLRDVILIGHSMGGKTAMLFALQNPEKVKRMIVVDIALKRSYAGREHQHLMDAMLAVDLTIARSRGDVDRQLKTWEASEKLRLFLLKNLYWRDRQTLDWRLNLNSLNLNLPAVAEGVDFPGTYPGPVLFLRGGLSDYLTDLDWPEIQMKFPAARVETIANASHWVHADAPGEFYDRVALFLSH